MSSVHPTAIVDKGAKLADNVEVGPYSIIEKDVTIGGGTKIGPHCFIGSFTSMGRNNRIFTGAIVGSVSQDLKFKGERSFLRIGDDNIIREYVTINRSARKDRATKIGNKTFIMAYSHIAHDCTIGNGVIIVNCGTLAGHVTVEDNAIVGGLTGVHQFVRIGRFAITGGCSKVVQDIAPYCMADGHPAKIRGVNTIGLKRADFSAKKIEALKKANKILFFSGLSTAHALKEIEKEVTGSEEVKYLVSFVKSSKRGLTR